MMPEFEEKILEHRGGHYIVQDYKGNVCEISDRYGPEYLRVARDFVTRSWLKLPVENRDDWHEMRQRYDPEAPERYPDEWEKRVEQLQRRSHVSNMVVHGPFWQLREWLGFEGLCMAFVDDPDWVREMVEFWTEFVSRTMRRALGAGVVDRLFINEDMAYKEKSMISPAMARDFLLPCWRRWTREAHEGGVSLVDMDSDGRVDLLIPLWIEAGMDVTDPLEVAAGCDIVALRERHGQSIAFRQGVDKRAIAAGSETIEQELQRVEPVVRDGGYIPGCDHGVPHDISWPDFQHYARLLAQMTGWL
jgi:uroporphyrinogen decarboxylase